MALFINMALFTNREQMKILNTAHSTLHALGSLQARCVASPNLAQLVTVIVNYVRFIFACVVNGVIIT
jgi:hypothetical protein